MIKFEVVSSYKDKDINLPKRGTKGSAGYDIEAAKDIRVPSLLQSIKRNIKVSKPRLDLGKNINEYVNYFEEPNNIDFYNLDDIKKIVKENKLRTMVPTGLKAQMDEGVVLKLYPRSSTGSNCLLHLANQTGIIDSDYYNNEDNEGHIFVPLLNLSPYDIEIKKGDKIAQGIFEPYLVTSDDEADGERKGGFGSTDKNLYDIPVGETRKIGNTLYKNDSKLGLINLPVYIKDDKDSLKSTIGIERIADSMMAHKPTSEELENFFKNKE